MPSPKPKSANNVVEFRFEGCHTELTFVRAPISLCLVSSRCRDELCSTLRESAEKVIGHVQWVLQQSQVWIWSLCRAQSSARTPRLTRPLTQHRARKRKHWAHSSPGFGSACHLRTYAQPFVGAGRSITPDTFPFPLVAVTPGRLVFSNSVFGMLFSTLTNAELFSATVAVLLELLAQPVPPSYSILFNAS